MLDFELLKKHVSLIFWDVFVDPKKRVLGEDAFIFFRIKEDKRRWERKRRRRQMEVGEKKKRMYPKKKEREREWKREEVFLCS